MKINKLGIVLTLMNITLVFGIAGVDGLLSTFVVDSVNGPSEMGFLTLMMLVNPLPFLAYGPAVKIPFLTWLYLKTYWTTCLHFAILGGLQWYLIGWLISSIGRKFVKTK